MTKIRFIAVLIVLFHLGINAQDIDSADDLGATIFNPYPLCAVNGESYSSGLGETMYGVQPVVPCNQGTPENIVWYSFIPCSSTATINIIPFNCPDNNGIQSGVYQSTSIFSGTSRLICEPSSLTTITLTSDQYIPGNVYYLMLDGFEGDMCDYTIEFVDGFLDTAPFANSEDIIVLADDVEECEPHTEFLQIRLVDFFAGNACVFTAINSFPASEIYQVSINAPGVSVTQKLKTKFVNNFDLTFPQNGDFDIEVTVTFNDSIPLLNCLPDFYLKRTATIHKIDTLESFVYLCENELPYDADSFIYNDFGVYESFFPDLCTRSIVNIEKSLNDTIALGTQYICPGSCFDLGGTQLCNTGFYAVLTDADCNEYTSVNLVNNNVVFNVNQDVTLDCTTPSVLISPIIQSDLNISIVNWYFNGQLLGTGPSYSVTNNGTYEIEVLFENMPPSCAETVEIYVAKNEDLIDFDVELPTLTCANPEGKILIITNDSYVSYEYSGQIIANSDLAGPVVNQAGDFTITLIGPNGCKSIKNITITEDFQYPNINFSPEDLTCINEEVLLSFQSDINITSQEWSYQNTSLSTQVEHLVNNPGIYSLYVEADNGCNLDTFVEIKEVKNYPLIDIKGDYFWFCKTKEINVANNVVNSNQTDYYWQTVNAVITPNGDDCIITQPGLVYLTATDVYSGCVSIDSLEVVINPERLNSVDLEIYSPKCEEEPFGSCAVTNIIGGTGPYTFQLNGQDVSEERLNELKPGNYQLTIADANGCEILEEFEISASIPFNLWGQQKYILKYTEEAEMEVFTDLDMSLLSSLIWYDSNEYHIGEGLTLVFGENKNEEILVELESIYGCVDSLIINLIYSDEIDFVYPNIFSPNGDEINDYFSIIGSGPPHKIVDFKIFDRFGGLGYHETGSSIAEDPMQWDGRFKNQIAQPGVYVFVLEYETENGKHKVFSGDITVIR